jgi:hypothetical protein
MATPAWVVAEAVALLNEQAAAAAAAAAGPASRAWPEGEGG